jgi:hypothetical protein
MAEQAFRRAVWGLVKQFVKALALYWWGKRIDIVE